MPSNENTIPARVTWLEREGERAERERNRLTDEKVDKDTYQTFERFVEKALTEIKDDLKTVKRIVVSVGVAIVIAALSIMLFGSPSHSPGAAPAAASEAHR